MNKPSLHPCRVVRAMTWKMVKNRPVERSLVAVATVATIANYYEEAQTMVHACKTHDIREITPIVVAGFAKLGQPLLTRKKSRKN